jgi:hypothetical protein
MKRVALFVGLVLASTPLAAGERIGRSGDRLPPHTIRLESPEPGETLVPGQAVTIRWQSNYPDVRPSQASPLYGETEIYLSLDGGATFPIRLTRQLSPTLRSFTWTVPNLPTERAVLDIRHGYEEAEVEGNGASEPAVERETRHIQAESSFAIAPAPAGAPEIRLAPLPAEIAGGETLVLAWTSTVQDASRYEVLVSTDRGAHFLPVGSTKESTFRWTVPADMSGRALVLVAAERADGSRVESLVRPDEAVRVRAE